jgi:DNA-binding Lrp family transcriptional regulator
MKNTKDLTILNILLENARLSFREISKKAKVSVVTVINRVRDLEKRGILKAYTAELDYEKLGYDVQAVIHLRIAQGKMLESQRTLAGDSNVFAVYDITGDFDSMVIAKFKSRRGLDTFLKKIQKYEFIKRSKTTLILNTIKEKNIKVE